MIFNNSSSKCPLFTPITLRGQRPYSDSQQMKSRTESHQKFSIPVLLQSLGTNQNPQSGYSSRVKSRQRGYQITSPPPSNEYEPHSALYCKSSRKNIQLEETGVQGHYENMQNILLSQNLNLKQQNSFLTTEIRKSIKNEEKMKKERKGIMVRLKEAEQDIGDLQQESLNTRELIESHLYYLSQALKTNNAQEIQNVILRYIDSVSAHFELVAEQFLSKSEDQTSIDPPFEQSQSKNSVQKQIQVLSKRLEEILEKDHDPNKGTSVRRQCIELSKQIKQLKAKSRTFSSNSISQRANSYQQITNYLPQSRIEGTRPANQDHVIMKKLSQRSEIIREEGQQDANRYPTQLYSKVTRRRSANRENKSVREPTNFYNTAQTKHK